MAYRFIIMTDRFSVARLNNQIEVVIKHKSYKVAFQGFIRKQDIDRLQPLFRRYLNKSQVSELNDAIQKA